MKKGKKEIQDKLPMSFFTQRQEAARPEGKRVYDGPLVLTSTDHPLHLPAGAPLDRENAGRLHAAPKLHHPTGFAGAKTVASTSVHTVLTGVDPNPQPQARAPAKGERYQYEFPTYAISRSHNGTAAKDILYGSAAPPAAPPAPPSAGQVPPGAEDHPALPLYRFLAEQVPQLPQDEQGNADENSVRAALSAVGVELSLDGFAELLARCDVSPTGFPPFQDFLLCLSRQPRPPPSGQSEPAAEPAPPQPPPPSVGFAMDHGTTPVPAKPAYRSHVQINEAAKAMKEVKLAVVMPERGAGAVKLDPNAVATASATMRDKTWGQMKMEESMNQRAQQQAAAAAIPPPKPGGSFPLGIRSDVTTLGNNVGRLYAKSRHASSQKFTNSFNPDFFVL